jgi:2-C-methyl-D-erythritol 4-phosphate cytidylyltransferase
LHLASGRAAVLLVPCSLLRAGGGSRISYLASCIRVGGRCSLLPIPCSGRVGGPATSDQRPATGGRVGTPGPLTPVRLHSPLAERERELEREREREGSSATLNLALVCVGAGRGERFGSDKLAEPLGDRTVLQTALEGLVRAFPDAPLFVVVPPNRMAEWRERIEERVPRAQFVAGGGRRQDSVRAGVERAAEGGADVVAVHDGARPLVDPSDVKGVVWALGSAAGSVLVAPVSDTVKRIDGAGQVLETVPRNDLRLALTPQVFRVTALAWAWQEADFGREWTDEAAMLESLGMPVRSVVAERPNPKLTTDLDLLLIRALMRIRG